MENLIDSNHGAATLIASLVVLLALNLVFGVSKFIWNISSKKQQNIEEDIKKIKVDLRRIFNIARYLAGDDWQKYREIMGDDLDS